MFKQYIFLLILSLFSAQSFAGSCPDGSEPVKSVSEDGSYYVFNCGGLMASEMPIHFTDAEWNTGVKTDHSEMSVDITVQQDDFGDHYFYAHTIYLDGGKNTENNEPNIMYAGFQNKGWSGEEWVGKMAIFSVWGAYEGKKEHNGWGTEFGGEGTGYSVRIPFEWNVGTTYRLTIKVIDSDEKNNVFAAFLTNLKSRLTKRIGKISVSKNRGLMYSPVSFHEVFMLNNDSVPSKCDEYSSSVVTFTNARADGKKLTPEIYLRNSYSKCKDISGSDYIQNGFKSWVQPSGGGVNTNNSISSIDEEKKLGKPPLGGTIFIDPNIVTPQDPSSFKSISYKGTGYREMYDRRSSWVNLQPFLFEAKFEDGSIIEMQVNPEFKDKSLAEVEAKKYAFLIGQLPAVLRKDIQTSWIHKGANSLGGGNNNILIHTGQTKQYEKEGILEETLIHEASHTSLDSYHAKNYAWQEAQRKDNHFISGYAEENPTREDIAESFLTYIAANYRSDRISPELKSTILKTIPNRIKYFDNQNFDLSLYSGENIAYIPFKEDILLNSARIDAKQKISGFRFIQEKYHKMVKKDGVFQKGAHETEITGWYQRLPRENDWHTGIIFFEKGQLKWKNEAGVEWNLQPDINNNKLITGEDNPYQTKYEPDFRLIKSSEKSKSVSRSSKKLPDNSKFSRNRYGFKCNSGFKREGNNMCTKDLAIAQKIAEAIKTSEKSKSVSQSEEYPTVNYNTKLDEVCRGLINNSWNGYLDINKNEFNSKGYMFVVAGEDGRCESGIGSNKEHALNECTKWQEENNIVGVCELYAEGEEVVWDGHLKPSK